jgi:hypothetical protein
MRLPATLHDNYAAAAHLSRLYWLLHAARHHLEHKWTWRHSLDSFLTKYAFDASPESPSSNAAPGWAAVEVLGDIVHDPALAKPSIEVGRKLARAYARRMPQALRSTHNPFAGAGSVWRLCIEAPSHDLNEWAHRALARGEASLVFARLVSIPGVTGSCAARWLRDLAEVRSLDLGSLDDGTCLQPANRELLLAARPAATFLGLWLPSRWNSSEGTRRAVAKVVMTVAGELGVRHTSLSIGMWMLAAELAARWRAPVAELLSGEGQVDALLDHIDRVGMCLRECRRSPGAVADEDV